MHYEGGFHIGLYHGTGKITTDSFVVSSGIGGREEKRRVKTSYEGQFVSGVFEGHGVLRSPEGTYTGMFKNGARDGPGDFVDM